MSAINSELVCPNLFLIGAQKAGSSTLYSYLSQHNQIATFGRKEPKIFSAASVVEARAKLATYSPSKVVYRYVLDASPTYSQAPKFASAPDNILNICGESVRFIYIIRNPVDRLISNFFWTKQKYGGLDDIDEYIFNNKQAIFTGRYDLQINKYLEFFDISSFYFLKFEDLKDRKHYLANDIFSWLGIEEMSSFTHEVRAATNKEITRSFRNPLIGKMIWSSNNLRRFLSGAISETQKQKLVKLLSREEVRVEPTQSKKKEILETYFIDSIIETMKITGLQLDCWLKAYD